jgi:hypothetical protein
MTNGNLAGIAEGRAPDLKTKMNGWHEIGLNFYRKEMPVMIKTLDIISEAIRSSKHPFKKTDGQSKKALKHRYERRKIKGYLHLTDALIEEAL